MIEQTKPEPVNNLQGLGFICLKLYVAFNISLSNMFLSL
jgi:hypothetical protein